ncbi:hypothetical protein DVS28_b0368 (plasmid) [Euzebya pacifica]|uniref:Uncharacterized protein n=1 Tax=Euzebya pacifica TaxID=1608957 RepID=A0A346Y6P1_9ACTN|nr:hypothetical protein [Euzebya pacifica]AXV10138.1 hypothetical protein DVS28_b0368 [Euzebya pacifica]
MAIRRDMAYAGWRDRHGIPHPHTYDDDCACPRCHDADRASRRPHATDPF